LDMRLQRSFNYAVRYIYDARRDAHITPLFIDLGWLKLKERRKYFLLCLVFRILILKEGPAYLSDSFTLLNEVNPGRRTRSHRFTLQIPLHRTAIFNNSFIVTASRLWNELPVQIVFSASLSIFKKRLYDHLNQYQ
jgi:hypothetical protein